MTGMMKNPAVYVLAFLLLLLQPAVGRAAAKDPLAAELELMGYYFGKENLEVTTSTRHPKLISQVPENMTVVTADEIENMNAHTLSEVLERVPGLFLTFHGRDFGSSLGSFSIQGSKSRHIVVLIDGVRYNFLGGGNVETNAIPLQIIKRIEIIKGPASASWGSSLGGIVNIISKDAGDSQTPAASFSASYGKRNSADIRADLHGKTGSIGYYLFSGAQHSNGLISSRGFENKSFYSKFNAPLFNDAKLTVTTGYSNPEVNQGNYPSVLTNPETDDRSLFFTGSIDIPISKFLGFYFNAYRFYHDLHTTTTNYETGALLRVNDYDDTKTGVSSKLVFEYGNNTAVLGFDYENGDLEQSTKYGPVYQGFGLPAFTASNPQRDKWAVFFNDTIIINRLAVTPGIRYDHDDISGSFISPSIGATYELGENSLIRASISRGFTSPALAETLGGGLFLDPNPSLKAEKVWSYQAGFETKAVKYLWIKTSLFHHNLENAIFLDPGGSDRPTENDLPQNDLLRNGGKVIREGLELEIKTVPVHNFSISAGFAYTHIRGNNQSQDSDPYTLNIGLTYNDKKSFRAELFGHYIHPGFEDAHRGQGYKYDDFIWNINMKKSFKRNNCNTEIFMTAHNIFNGSQHSFGDERNPERWFEAGLRFKF